ncbi:hypothetical protein L1987_22288 [Smallanthus sonchifolius]|uniref:Uncharacterized protein n=2 Tax=Smallanthus sonchifolius TaxID=185202 RepID=A0ACB9IEF1_9ASTR|nr:hypothetical protein L1987_22286 [Smallanthus sonchifolius]KAI3806386.1 hypothetical protein L1987_22288 [Smallanthus sonchifolius]
MTPTKAVYHATWGASLGHPIICDEQVAPFERPLISLDLIIAIQPGLFGMLHGFLFAVVFYGGQMAFTEGIFRS